MEEPVRRLSDEELLASGEPELFARFFERHAKAIEAYFRRRVHDPDTAEDLAAETFAAAIVARRRFQAGEKPALAWLFGIAAHKLADHYRRASAEDRATRRLRSQPRALPHEDVADALEGGALIELVDELPPRQREAVRLHVLEDRSYAELAAAAGASESVVRKRVSRGLALLRTWVVAGGAAALLIGVALTRSGSDDRSTPGGPAVLPLTGTFDRAPARDRGHVLLAGEGRYTIVRRHGHDYAFSIGPRGQGRGLNVRTGRMEARGREVLFTGDSACGERVPGRYRWARSGTELRFTAIADACPGRRTVLTTSAWHAR